MASRLTHVVAAVSLAALATGCSASPRPDEAPMASTAKALSPVARYDVNRLDAAIHRYAADRAGRLPASLSALVSERAPGGEAYVTALPTDPWGAPYVYAVLDTRLGSYDLRSYGADRLPATEDDVVARADPVPLP